MRIRERSYSSNRFRPKPFIKTDGDATLLVMALSWGQGEAAERVVEEISKYVSAARGDVEVTSPFETLTCLSDEANHLRVAFMIANELLYRGENKSEYNSGVEVLALSRIGRQIVWAQVGGPHLLLRRADSALVPVSVSYDHSFEVVARGPMPPPLPARLMGVDSSCAIMTGEIVVEKNDQLVLLAASSLPQVLWGDSSLPDLPALTSKMIESDPDSPFWIAHVDL